MSATTSVWNTQSTSSLLPPAGLISEGEVTGTHSASTSSPSVAKVMANSLSSTGDSVGLSNCTMSTTSNVLACTSRCLEHAASLSRSGFITPRARSCHDHALLGNQNAAPAEVHLADGQTVDGLVLRERAEVHHTAFRPTPSTASDAKNANERARNTGSADARAGRTTPTPHRPPRRRPRHPPDSRRRPGPASLCRTSSRCRRYRRGPETETRAGSRG